MAGALADDVIANRYRLAHELGKGGMGTVWRAHDDRLNRAVALKLMAKRLLLDKTAVDRFEREAKAVARLLSPHIVQIYDYGVDPQPFMVMELLKGENLSQRLAREGLLPLDEVASIIRQSARGLATAHEEGIVHRDLKPGNLFIVRDRDTEFVKVVDFGIAKAVRRQATLTAITTHNQPVGTPQYMSPNQLRAKEDSRDDIWSLAVITYKALCGAHPFASDSLVELVQRIMDEPHVPPSEYQPSLPPELDAVFDRAFDKDREARFQSAPEFSAALDMLLTETPVPVDPPSHDAVSTTHPIPVARTSAPPSNPRISSIPDDTTGEVTLVRPRGSSNPGDSMPITQALHASQSLRSAPPLDPTIVDPITAVAPVGVPTPTPPPAATPWPIVARPSNKQLVGPIVIGVGATLATVAVAAWLLFPAALKLPPTR